MDEQKQYQEAYPDEFSRQLGMAQGTLASGKQPTVIRPVGVIGVGGVTSYSVQTFRRIDRNEEGRVVKSHDTIFLEIGRPNGTLDRFVLPPAVADIIARHRDSLTTKFRKLTAKGAAAKRKASGYVPVPPKRRAKAAS